VSLSHYSVNARFYVARTTRYANGQSRPGFADPAPMGEVILLPVVRGDANKEWASATPSGEMKMVIHGSAMTWFEQRLGAELAITFDDVSKD
jgi:hypothetical protein